VKNDVEDEIVDRVSAMEMKINSGQEEQRQEISAFQDKTPVRLNLKRGCVMGTLDTQLKSVTAQVQQQARELQDETRNLREDFNKEIRAGLQTVGGGESGRLATIEAVVSDGCACMDATYTT
jgi:hypothetical protein